MAFRNLGVSNSSPHIQVNKGSFKENVTIFCPFYFVSNINAIFSSPCSPVSTSSAVVQLVIEGCMGMVEETLVGGLLKPLEVVQENVESG